MITTIDLTEEPWSDIPDPSRVFHDDDDVVLQFSETNLRFSYLQFVTVIDACHEWIFRGLRHEPERDINDEQYVPEAEHARLRDFISTIVETGTVGVACAYKKPGPVHVPKEVVAAIKSALVHFWREEPTPGFYMREQEATIRKLRARVEVLENEEALRSRRIKDLEQKITRMRGEIRER